MQYDPIPHLLLRDVAHMQCIHDDVEYQDFVDRVIAAGADVFEVDIPDWPIVRRQPLPIITMAISVDGSDVEQPPQGGPTAMLTWKGRQLAVERRRWDDNDWVDRWIARDYRDDEELAGEIAREMVPVEFVPAHRLGYAWQVPVFDPAQHVVIRYWCERNHVDIVDFWRRFYPEVEDRLPVIETTNPRYEEEVASGSYSPTRRCIRKDDLYLLRNEYLGANENPPDQDEPRPRPQEPPQPRFDRDDSETGDQPVQWNVHDGVVKFPASEAIRALEDAVGRDVRPFSGTSLDKSVVAISQEAMARYLVKNPVNQRQYILDSGGRNYDCDDFAITLRTNMIRDHGYNCIAVIAGDVHAWCAFILARRDGTPMVAFVEPQTDGIVAELTGMYSVANRCEVII